MNLSQRTKISWSLFLSLILTNIPYLAWADSLAPQQMIATSVVVSELSRSQAEEKVQNFLARTDVRSEFLKRGLSTEEVSQRLASLSEQELKQLATQMDEARYGGDVIGILLVVVLVLLIIYLAKRV